VTVIERVKLMKPAATRLIHTLFNGGKQEVFFVGEDHCFKEREEGCGGSPWLS
jgi:hypothetical protein